MAVFKVLTQKWSVANGPGCLSWCFGTQHPTDQLDQTLDAKDGADYGSTKENGKKKKGKHKANGNASNYLHVSLSVYPHLIFWHIAHDLYYLKGNSND